MKLDFRPVRPFAELTKNIESNVFSGIYIWGFKFHPTDNFLPYYVGLAGQISIYERLIHHYTKLNTTYKIFDSIHLKYFYKYLSVHAEPKVLEKDKLKYENKNDGKFSKACGIDSHINHYRDNFHYTYAPFSCKENQKRNLEFLETYVKYSLPNQTVSKSELSINGNSFKNRQDLFKKEFGELHLTFQKKKEFIFKKTPSSFPIYKHI